MAAFTQKKSVEKGNSHSVTSWGAHVAAPYTCITPELLDLGWSQPNALDDNDGGNGWEVSAV
ncbi:hypothetical protein HYALB_00013282 [Hymenoscyphus albidus]|uniref:Uncharacterized protein n=1 Tax=Hymenoscyphus albidus TaxID=595503 RepID=A0A9N9LUI5_9HELO|nr:hypothetical protein HYALB_00013282 [Hymenoscyphus albidus]